ncbi:hypothetical protein Mapa_016141 [Marchantia paleacea]|nr:hypothetical protein Mapa_016141 [Marchantia paleacea]
MRTQKSRLRPIDRRVSTTMETFLRSPEASNVLQIPVVPWSGSLTCLETDKESLGLPTVQPMPFDSMLSTLRWRVRNRIAIILHPSSVHWNIN